MPYTQLGVKIPDLRDFDHQPKIIDHFMGLYDRGSDSASPIDHASSCQNCRFVDSDVTTRFGLSAPSITLGSVRRMATYKRIGEASRLLILDNNGNLFDSVVSLVSPILTIATMVDFSMVNFNNRAYISPHDGTQGLAGQSIYVYDGTTCRIAGGNAPTTTFTVSTSASSGFCEAGIHLFAIAFETASGFITPPGPTNYVIYAAPGGFKATVASLPIGPIGTVARRILATKVIPVYNGNQNISALYFVPGGRVPDNVTTSVDVSFFDQDLQSSAEYLKNIYSTLPACLHLTTYKDRLVASNYNGGNSVALISRFQDPETFSQLDNFIVVDPTESTGIKSAIEFRDTLYIFKSLRGYAVNSLDGSEPSSWSKPTGVDRGAGTEVFGISRILDANGTNTDKFFIADKSGLLIFNGTTQHPPLSWKISNYWSRINANVGNQVQVLQDTTKNLLYILLPLDSSTKPNVVLLGDYSNGMDQQNIRWMPWSFPYTNLCGVVDVNTSTQKPFLRLGSLSGNVYDQNIATDDNGTAINAFYRTSLLDFGNEGTINHISHIRVRASGSGLLRGTIYGQDGSTSQPLANTTLTTNPITQTRKCNFKSPRISIQFGVQNFGETFLLTSIVVLWKELWVNG